MKLSYIINLEIKKNIKVDVGRLGKVFLEKGIYAYVGSSPANRVHARIKRHMKRNKNKFWHIDRVTSSPFSNVKGAVILKDKECEVAARFINSGYEVPCRKFGSSDCACVAHFFKVGSQAEFDSFVRTRVSPLEGVVKAPHK